MIYMDFVYDFTEIVTELLEKRKVKDVHLLSPSRRFSMLFDSESRQIPIHRYNVKISEELKSKSQWYPLRDALKEIAERFKKGKTLQPYLSKLTEKIDRVDQLLQHWGINHLHISPLSTQGPDGFVARSDHLLLFRINGNDVHLIDVLPHKAVDLFSQPELVRIMDRNWPSLCVPIRGAVGMTRTLNAANYKTLRKSNGMAPIETDRGVVMTPFAVNTAGTTYESVKAWDGMVVRLRQLQDVVQLNYKSLFNPGRAFVSSIHLLSVETDGFILRDGATNNVKYIPNTNLI